MQFVQKLLGGGSSTRKQDAVDRQQQLTEAANNQKIQEISQNQQLQAQANTAADTDKGLASARKATRGRRLLMDTGTGKSTVG